MFECQNNSSRVGTLVLCCLFGWLTGAVLTNAAPVPKPRKPMLYDDGPLRLLVRDMPVPSKPVDTGDPQRWAKVEQKLGTKLPEEYKRFVGLYGHVHINGHLRFFGPFAGERNFGLLYWLGSTRSVEADRRELDFAPLAIWPEARGLLPIGNTSGSVTIAYRTGGSPDRWTISTVNRESKVYDHDCGLVEFLTRLARGVSTDPYLLETDDFRGRLTAEPLVPEE